MPLQGLVLGDGEVVVLHVDLEEFDLLVCGTGGQVLVVGGNFHLQDVVIMNFNSFLVLFCHVLAVKIDEAFVVAEGHAFQAVAHRNRPDAVVGLDCGLVLRFIVEVPFADEAPFISEHNGTLIGVQDCAVDRFVIFMFFDCVLYLHVEYPQSSVLARSVD